MKKLSTLLAGGLLLVSLAACGTAKTNTSAPNDTDNVGQAAEQDEAQQNKGDAASDVRKRQLESDIRAREERNNATGGDADRANGDLASEVRSKLEANLPDGQLAVDAEDGTVTVSGTVPTAEQLARVEPLAKEIKGVETVTVNVKVAPMQPEGADDSGK